MAETKKTAAEVGVKLVVDSDAKKATEEIKGHLSGLAEKIKGLGKHVDMSISGNLASLKGLALGGVEASAAVGIAAFGAMVGGAYKATEAFEEGEEAAKGLAGTLTMIDQGGNSFQDLREYADEVKDDLDGIAMSAGETKGAVGAMFTDIVERG